ncbi:MAG: META domain-containing protein [Prolixibacteraceae bacterium]
MKSFYQCLAFISLLFFLISCYKDHDSEVDSIFHTWEAKNFISIESVAYPKFEGHQILITFNPNGTYQLQLDVNQCLGTYQSGFNSQIGIGSAGCTKICCDSEFSIKLVEMLPKVGSFKINGKTLNLEVPNWGWIEFERIE